jgi:hypothetical protein
MAQAFPLPAPAHGAPPEEDVDLEGGGAVIVTDEVPQKHVHHVIVDTKRRHVL